MFGTVNFSLNKVYKKKKTTINCITFTIPDENNLQQVLKAFHVLNKIKTVVLGPSYIFPICLSPELEKHLCCFSPFLHLHPSVLKFL